MTPSVLHLFHLPIFSGCVQLHSRHFYRNTFICASTVGAYLFSLYKRFNNINNGRSFFRVSSYSRRNGHLVNISRRFPFCTSLRWKHQPRIAQYLHSTRQYRLIPDSFLGLQGTNIDFSSRIVSIGASTMYISFTKEVKVIVVPLQPCFIL